MLPQMFAGGRLESVRCRWLTLAFCAMQPDRNCREDNSAEQDRSPSADLTNEAIPHLVEIFARPRDGQPCPIVDPFLNEAMGLKW